MAKALARLLATPLRRRQALKLIAGTAGALTLAACGVAPGESPDTRTNLLVLRARVKNLEGRDRERLRAIADFLDPVNRNQVDILGEYWAEGGLFVGGKPGNEFINDGIDIVVLAKGESAAAVRAWADQWAGLLDIASDEAIASDLGPVDPNDGDQTFLVFERIEGATAPEAVFGAEPGEVDIASHHTLINDGLRQVMVVRAPSYKVVHGWVHEWGARQSIEVLKLTNLSEQLKICAQSSCTTPDTAVATAVAAAHLATISQETIEVAAAPTGPNPVANYNPKGLLLREDQKLGSFYFRHQATGRFLSIDGGLKVVTVATPVPGDLWDFTRGEGLDSGNYYLRHQGTGRYLNGDLGDNPYDYVVPHKGNAFQSTSPQTWVSGLTTLQQYGIRGQGRFVEAGLTVDDNFMAHTGEGENWEQWSDYHYPTELEQTLHDLVTTAKYDEVWPEDLYKGEELAAYNDILTYLSGQAPKNGKVTTAELTAAQDQVIAKNGGVLPPAYNTVFVHLLYEVGYHETLTTWYGDSGHVQYLLSTETIDRDLLLKKVQDLAKPPPQGNVNLAIGAFFSLVSITIATTVTGPAGGAVIGAIIAAAWRTYSTATGGKNDTLSTTFADLAGSVASTFDGLTTQREKSYSTIQGNWGRLRHFAELVASNKLVWPDDTDSIRREANRQFEVSVWQAVTHAHWNIGGMGGWAYEINAEDPSDKAVQEHWVWEHLTNPWTYVILLPIKYQSNKTHEDVVPGLATDLCYVESHGPDTTLAKRLFDYDPNANPDFKTDPNASGLGISMTDFFLSRNGWRIPGNVG